MNLSLRLLLILFLALGQARAEPLEAIEDCVFLPTDWADGDSFQIQTPDARKFTVRLYAADCLEFHVTDANDARRLRAQRRYFGLSEFGGSPEKSIALAKELGGLAAKETARALDEPFTVHTAYADGGGDGRHKRIYAYITTADGKDLSAHLVSLGLARAFGVERETPTGTSGKNFGEELADLELRAAKLGLGAWEHTDWDQLSLQRNSQRQEDAELNLATGLKGQFSGRPLNVNLAARDELMTLPGIGEVMANRIIEGRPYRSPADLSKVNGIGKTTLDRLAPLLVFAGP